MSKLEDKLTKAYRKIEEYYKPIIEIHENYKLRYLVMQRGKISIVKDMLFYTYEGFNANVLTNFYSGNDLKYNLSERSFYERKGILLVDCHYYGEREMRGLFPTLTIKRIKKKLGGLIKESSLLQIEPSEWDL